jgi:zinc/manganese transport system substrate-binding protein
MLSYARHGGVALLLAAATLTLAGCGSASKTARPGQIVAVGAENEYANVIQQIGGRYVSVTAIMSNPNTDPHSFEASPSVAKMVSAARLIVQNGVGYDSFMDNIEAATANSARKVIDVQKLLGLPNSTPNPHLWYSPKTMPAVAAALAKALKQMQPDHAAYFTANVRRFDGALKPWLKAIARFKAKYPSTPVATTEPVGDYMLQAAGTSNLTPFGLQADIMNGVDPAPQDITLQNGLFSGHKVKVFVYNQQVTDTLTQNFKSAAARAGIPVVGVYETMPLGYSYQGWMLAEVQALQRAVADHKSTEKL